MEELHIILFGIWFGLFLIKKFKMKRGILDGILLFFTVAAFLVFEVFQLSEFPYFNIEYLLYGGLLYSILMFNVKEVFSRSHIDSKYKQLKKSYDDLEHSYDMLRKRFVNTIELFPDGIAFRTNEGIFGTDDYIKLLDFEKNEFTFDAFMARMHREDINAYENTLKKTSNKNPYYKTSYRYKIHDKFIWIEEIGRRIIVDRTKTYISIIRGLDVKMYPKTDIDVLNTMQTDKEFLDHLQSLNRMKTPYTLIFIELANIPKVNEKYGRDIGDLMMGEFLKKLKFNFVKDAQSLYRLSGIRFALILKDQRKYEVLERALSHGGDLMNFDMRYGGVNQSIFPYFGIHHVSMFSQPVNDLVQRAHKALNIALEDHTQENYFVIR